MNKKTFLLGATALFALTAFAAEPAEDVVLRGVFDMGDRATFSLSSPGGQTNGWAEVGDEFLGYEITGYDADAKVLSLSRDGVEYTVGLAGVAPGTGPKDIAEARAEAIALFDKMHFQEMIEKVLDGQAEAMSQAMRQQMAASTPDGSVDEGLLAFQEKAMREMFAEMDWDTMEKGMTEAYAEVFTPAELRGMNEFYSTPAGQASIEKSPELQAKTMQIMMPEIMRASQSMSQKMQTFLMERQAAEAAQ